MALDKRLRHLLSDKSPLVALQKFVSTTVRPTLLPYTELYDWDGCASFVSDYLVMEPLECPITLVRKGLQSHQEHFHNGGARGVSWQDTMWKPQWLGLQRSLTSPSCPHYLGNPPIFPGPAHSGPVIPVYVQCGTCPGVSTISTRWGLALLPVIPYDQLSTVGCNGDEIPLKDQNTLEQRSV